MRLLSKIESVLSFKGFERVIHVLLLVVWSTVTEFMLALATPPLRAYSWFGTLLLVSSHLTSLHWLRIRFRIHFKILLFVFKSLNGMAPQHISDLFRVRVPSRSLRSADQLHLVVPNTTKNQRGPRLFSSAP